MKGRQLHREANSLASLPKQPQHNSMADLSQYSIYDNCQQRYYKAKRIYNRPLKQEGSRQTSQSNEWTGSRGSGSNERKLGS